MDMELTEERKSRKTMILLTVVGITTMIVAMAGTALAFFTATITPQNETNSINIETATIAITYNNGSAVNTTGLMPGGSIDPKTVSVANATTYDAKYSLVWTADVVNTFTNENEITYAVTCEGTGAPTNITSTALPPTTGSTQSIFTNVTLPAGATHSCVFTFAYPDTLSNQNVDQGKMFSGNFAITADPITP